MLRDAIERLLGSLKDIEAGHVEEVLAALDKPAGKVIGLPGGLCFAIEYDRYVLGAGAAIPAPFPVLEGEHHLKIPGRTILPGWEVEAAIIDRAAAGEDNELADGLAARFDFNLVGGKLAVRRRRPGDRFQPLGMGQPKKLNAFMIDARIPRAWRPRVPIVCTPTQIVWVAGWRIDDRVKVTEGTEKVLRLKFQRR